MKPLKEMTAQERSELIEAFVSCDKEVLRLHTVYGWVEATNLYVDHVYKVVDKEIHDSIPWEHISEEYHWYARDKNGVGFVFTDEPSRLTEIWDNIGECSPLRAFKGFKAGNTDWKESKQKRPEKPTPPESTSKKEYE